MMNIVFDDYRRGMEKLFVSAPVFAVFAQSLGAPVATHEIPTAAVMWDKQSKRITFGFNPNFIKKLTDDEVGAVIGHETYHVLLDHLQEVMDPQYKDQAALVDAHECIINDGLTGNIGLKLPKGVKYGIELYKQDFSWFSTREAYDFILAQQEDKQEEDSDEDSDEGEKGQGTPGVGGGSGKGDKSQESQKGSGSPDKQEQEDSQKGSGDSDKEEQEGDSQDEGEGSGSSKGDSDEDASEGDAPVFDCSGPQVDAEDMQDFMDALKKAVGDVMDSGKVNPADLPSDLADALSDMLPGKNWGMGGPGGAQFLSPQSHINMNWLKLLELINPQVKSAGIERPKESWAKPRRKMMYSYPQVVLPGKMEREPDREGKGRALPTLIPALDLSGSIPRTLVNDLVALVDQVPTKFITPRPCTWSDNVVEWDSETKQVVRGGGTNIRAVYAHADKIRKELGADPYVLVITDGECSFGDYYYYGGGMSSSIDQAWVKSKWFWVAIQPGDEHQIRSNFRAYLEEGHVFRLRDFTS